MVERFQCRWDIHHFQQVFLLDFVYQYLMSERNDVSFCELRDFERNYIFSTKTSKPKPHLRDVGRTIP